MQPLSLSPSFPPIHAVISSGDGNEVLCILGAEKERERADVFYGLINGNCFIVHHLERERGTKAAPLSTGS